VNFFERQDVARRSTGRLVVLFGLATVTIILSVYAVVTLALTYVTKELDPWQPALFAVVVVATVSVIGLGSLYKIVALRGGGSVVAESLGGKLIPQDTDDPLGRKVLNVVEEMAIASGTAVPPVYLMDKEPGINAFAAGYTPSDAVIGVTRGCVEQLSRSELQGVIAHEFSHVLNGDMRLNIRLMGILHGILIIGLIGYYLLRTMAYGRRGKDGAAAVMAIGAGLAVVGFAGTFFGNWIKAGVSRQREYLADASAVQYTRNPDSVAGALKRIGGATSQVASPAAAEISHMFFARSITKGLNSMFSTHPPLADRIQRIDPGWDGNYPSPRLPAPSKSGKPAPKAGLDVGELITGAVVLAGAAGAKRATEATGDGGESTGPDADVLDQIGNPTPAHVELAAEIVRDLPESVAQAVREPYGARAVIYAMLVNRDETARRVQLERVAAEADPGVAKLTRELLGPVQTLDARARLPLIDLAMPALRELSPAQYTVFQDNVTALVEADDAIDLFEWVLQRLLLRHLHPKFGDATPTRVRYHAPHRLAGPISRLLSVLSHVGHADAGSAAQAFEEGKRLLEIDALSLIGRESAGLPALDEALDLLDAVSFPCKRELLAACVACIRWDHEVTIEEAELFRGIADSLGCPVPPLLPGSSRS